MFELIDAQPIINVQEAEYIRLLGYPRNYALEGRPRELAQWAREWFQKNANPWVYARQANSVQIGSDGISIEGTSFLSTRLSQHFEDAHADGAFVAAVSAGEECEEMARQLWLEEKPDEYFFLEMFGSAVVEHLIVTTGFRFCEWADSRRKAILPHYSPGYPGWDIKDQRGLMNVILRNRTNVFPRKLLAMETGMLIPKKSILAVFGITSHVDRVERLTNLVPCENCSLASCQYRRVPYRRALPQIESIQTVRAAQESKTNEGSHTHRPFAPDAKYTLSLHALRKWAKERLQLRHLHDGSIQALFRYEGTTCSNLGRPLEFLYHVRLGPPESRYKVEEARSIPSPTDDGHTYMCEYLKKGDSFIGSIGNEQPLLGRPLDDVFVWARTFHPSGCFCEPASRRHKWGLVYEVLHYFLAHNSGTPNIEIQTEKSSQGN